MTSLIDEVQFTRISAKERQKVCGQVVREMPLTIRLNGKELLTTLCSPDSLEYLVMGILSAEGYISDRGDVTSLKIDSDSNAADVTTGIEIDFGKKSLKPLVASCGIKGSSGLDLLTTLKPAAFSVAVTTLQVQSLVKFFLHSSVVYAATHGVHSAALCAPEKILIFKEDIGRHNALDKVFGAALLQGTSLNDKIVITSGRISSEILLKVAARGVQVLISKAPPTDLGVRLANRLNVTLVKAVPGVDLIVYSGDARVINNGVDQDGMP
jgi:FdhD protein